MVHFYIYMSRDLLAHSHESYRPWHVEGLPFRSVLAGFISTTQVRVIREREREPQLRKSLHEIRL